MAGKLPKKKPYFHGGISAPVWKAKRRSRRAAERHTALEPVFLPEHQKTKPRRPAPILVLFFLDRIKTKVDHKLEKVVDPYGTSFSFTSTPVVMIRDIRTKKVKHGKRMVEEEHFTQWRPFPHAMPVCDQDNVSATSQFIGIQAPMDAWAKAGLLDGMILRDLPREQTNRFVDAALQKKRAA